MSVPPTGTTITLEVQRGIQPVLDCFSHCPPSHPPIPTPLLFISPGLRCLTRLAGQSLGCLLQPWGLMLAPVGKKGSSLRLDANIGFWFQSARGFEFGHLQILKLSAIKHDAAGVLWKRFLTRGRARQGAPLEEWIPLFHVFVDLFFHFLWSFPLCALEIKPPTRHSQLPTLFCDMGSPAQDLGKVCSVWKKLGESLLALHASVPFVCLCRVHECTLTLCISRRGGIWAEKRGLDMNILWFAL